MRIRKQNQNYLRTASNAAQSLDLMNDFALENSVILAMRLFLRGTMTAAGGGAISGFHRDAPCGMITTARCWGNYAGSLAKSQRTIFDMPPQQMFYPGNLFANLFNALLRTSTGAGNTDPFRATIPVPLVDPLAPTRGMTYIDCRDYTSFKLDLRWAPDTDLATTNLATVQAMELEVEFDIWEDAPARGTPHYEPEITYKELPLDTASTRLVRDGDLSWNGDLWAIWMQQFDSSGAGDAQRVDGDLRALSIEHGKGQLIPFSRWDPLHRQTWARYPYALSTTEIAGVAGVHLDQPARARNGKLNLIRNTSETNPPGVTAITPAAGDALMVTLVSAEPVYHKQGRR